MCHTNPLSALFSSKWKSGDRYLIVNQQEKDTITTASALLELKQGENPINYIIFYNKPAINYVTLRRLWKSC